MPTFQVMTDLFVRSGPGTEFDTLDTLEQGDVIEGISTVGWMPILMEDGSIGWVSKKFLTEPSVLAPDPVVSTGEPIWITWARKHLGQKEISGPASNPVIEAWYHLTTLPKYMWTDSTAWCAVFVNAAFMLNNIKGLRSADAEAWKNFGTKSDTPKKGDVVVFEWDNSQHHVAFFLRDLGNGRIEVIGGNQSDTVTIENYPVSNVLAYRRV